MSKVSKQADLELLGVINDSDPNGEKVRIKVVSGGNVRGYAIVDNTFDADAEPSNEFRHIFVFPSLEVATDDFIHVVTGVGEYKGLANAGKTITHKLYWNSDECVWNDKEGDEATLFKFSILNRVIVPARKDPPAFRKLKVKPKE
jgi:hypothetical protein